MILSIFIPSRWHFKKLNRSNLNFSKMVGDINTKFSPVVSLDKNPPCQKFEVSKVQKIWISCQKPLKLLMGVAGPFFEPRPPNLVRIHFLVSCKNAEILVMISWVVKELAKISGSVPSISRDVLELFHNPGGFRDPINYWWARQGEPSTSK